MNRNKTVNPNVSINIIKEENENLKNEVSKLV